MSIQCYWDVITDDDTALSECATFCLFIYLFHYKVLDNIAGEEQLMKSERTEARQAQTEFRLKGL